MSGRIAGILALSVVPLLLPANAGAQTDPLDPDNPARERIFVGGRVLAVDRPNIAPTADSVNPSSGSGSSQVFTFTYPDLNGYADIKYVHGIVNASLTGLNSCYLYYNRNTDYFYLRNDANTAWLGPLSSTLENSQCRLSASGSSASGTGSELTVQFDLTFLSGFSGSKTTYGYSRDQADANSAWQTLGSWTVP